MPAWLHDDSAGSLKLVSVNTSPVDEAAVEMCVADVVARFLAGVAVGLAHEERREPETERGVGEAEEERLGPQPVLGGDEPGRQRGDGDRAVAGGLVQAHRETAPGGADEVDLHDHRRRPGESLVDAEQHVGEDDPAPRRCPHQQQRHRQADQPARDQDRLAADPIGERPGEEVGGRLDRAEGDDERERGGERGEPEDVLRRAAAGRCVPGRSSRRRAR